MKLCRVIKYSCFTLLTVLISIMNSTAQIHNYYSNNASPQLGVSVKLAVEIGNKDNLVNWRCGISGGTGAFLGNNWLYPSLNADFMLYHGGIGSSLPGNKASHKIEAELNISYTITAGLTNRLQTNSKLNPSIRDYPLYYFNIFNKPALQNPFNWSASWGGNAIISFTRPTDKFQQVGFLNLHLDRIQLSYTNDGPPFFVPFGDKYDRFYTGGGFISFHGNGSWPVNLVQFGFNKFTGYSKNAYELSNEAGVIYLYYKDEKQQFYNKSQFFLNIGSTTNKWEANLNLYNYQWLDIQHKIHQSLFYPLHMVSYKHYIGVGASYIYSSTKIGMQ